MIYSLLTGDWTILGTTLTIMTEEFHQIGQNFDASSSNVAGSGSSHFPVSFEFGNGLVPHWSSDMNLYETEAAQWSAITLTAPHQQLQLQIEDIPGVPQHPSAPWSSQDGAYRHNASSGGVAFEPVRGTSYETHITRQGFLDVYQSNAQYNGADPVSPISDNDGSWAIVSQAASNYTPSNGSSVSQPTPPPCTSSLPHQQIEIRHSHIYNSLSKPSKKKALRGRQRCLTTIEKKQAREVRDAKACWACHISKTKVCLPNVISRAC